MNPIVEEFRKYIDQPFSDARFPVGQWLAGVLKEVNEGHVTAEVTIRPEMANYTGRIHGGMLALIIDDLIGGTTYTLGTPTVYMSVNLSVDYLLTAKVGETLTGTTRIIRKGRTLINAECEISNARGKLIARGHSNLVNTGLPQPTAPKNSN